MKLLRNLGGMLSLLLLLGLLMSTAPAGAQTLTGLSFERSITLTNVLTTTPPALPPSVLAALASGALDFREQINFNPQANTITSTLFVVPSGSPNPTNLALLPFNAFLAVVTGSVTDIHFSSKPVAAVQIDSLVQNSTGVPLQGALASLSFSYSSDKPPKISNVIETAGGIVVLYSASSQGTFAITQPPSGGGGGGTAPITVMINGSTVGASGATFQTVSNLIDLDASATTTSNSGATLKFLWTLASGSPGATITDSDKSKVHVILGAGKGTYIVQLQVTDSTGTTTTVNITIQFV